MIASDEDSLICDLAQVYGIFDYHALPVRTLAALAAGLPEDSRCIRHLRDEPLSTHDFLLAASVDALFNINWRLQGCPGTPPPSLLSALRGKPEEDADSSVQSFDSPEEFEAAMKETERRIAYGD